MFTKKHFINLISLAVLAFANLAYLLKLNKVVLISPVILWIYFIGWIALVFFIDAYSIHTGKEKIKKIIPIFITIAVLLPHLAAVFLGLGKNGTWFITEQDLFISAVLFIALVYLTERTININFFDLILFAFLFGAMIFYQPFLIFAAVIYILYKYRSSFPKLLTFLPVFFLTFFFMPYLLSAFKLDYLLHYSSGFDFSAGYIFLLLAAVYIGWIAADMQEVLFASGVILFFPIFINAIAYSLFGSVKTASTGSFIICVPFLLLAIRNYKVDKFLGKIFNILPEQNG
jgi:hypothetical protein